MAIKLYREYDMKFYLNARHYIIIDGQQGDIHPHTWEFSLRIRIGRGAFTPFMVLEKTINAFLEPYQNQVLNEVEPFGQILPTLENMTDYFTKRIRLPLLQIGGELIRVEASETPTRSYVLDIYDGHEEEDDEIDMLPQLVDSVLDDILGEMQGQGERR